MDNQMMSQIDYWRNLLFVLVLCVLDGFAVALAEQLLSIAIRYIFVYIYFQVTLIFQGAVTCMAF